MTRETTVMGAFARSILEHPHDFDWSLQGFGMLRVYVGEHKRFRLNVRHSKFAVPNVSIIHNHPWDFRSWILAGRFTNVRYQFGTGDVYKAMMIEPGDKGGPAGDEQITIMHETRPEDTYEQRADEVHASYYTDGTVTLNDRTGRRNADRAMVYWRDGEWVDAKPRTATRDEVAFAASEALGRFQ